MPHSRANRDTVAAPVAGALRTQNVSKNGTELEPRKRRRRSRLGFTQDKASHHPRWKSLSPWPKS